MSHIEPKKRAVATLLLLIIEAGLLVFLPPTNIFLIVGFVLNSSLLTFFLTSLFLKSYSYLLASFVFLLLTINYLIGFQLLTIFLLVCFIIGIGILTKK